MLSSSQCIRQEYWIKNELKKMQRDSQKNAERISRLLLALSLIKDCKVEALLRELTLPVKGI